MTRMVAAAVVAWTIAAGAEAQPRLPAPPADIAALPLPEGELLPGSQGERNASFVVQASVKRIGGTVAYQALEIYHPGIKTAYGVAVEVVSGYVLDCGQRTRRPLGSQAFDEAGRVVMWLPAEGPIAVEAGSEADYQKQMLCDGAPPPGPPLRGHATALQVARAILGGAR